MIHGTKLATKAVHVLWGMVVPQKDMQSSMLDEFMTVAHSELQLIE